MKTTVDTFHKPPVFIQTLDATVYSSDSFREDAAWSEVESVPLQNQSLLEEQQWYRRFIPFSLYPLGNVVALHPYETPTLSGQGDRATYYALLDDGTLWYWHSTEIEFVKGLYFVCLLNVIGLIVMMIGLVALKNRLVYEFDLQSSRLTTFADSRWGFVSWLMASLLLSPLVTVIVSTVRLRFSGF